MARMATEDDAGESDNIQASSSEQPPSMPHAGLQAGAETKSTESQHRPFLKIYLESLCLQMVDLINTKTFTHECWDLLLAPTYRGSATKYPGESKPGPVRVSRKEWLVCMVDIYALHPEWRIRPLDTSSEVDAEGRSGTVWFNYETVGIPAGLVTTCFAVLEFRGEKGGKWRCVNFEGVQGGVV